MALKLSKLAIDNSAETEGVWVEFVDGCEFRIARMNNPAWENYVAKQAERKKSWHKSAQNNRDLTWKAYSLHIVKDWKGLVDDDGTEIPYSSEMAFKLLTDYPEIRDFVIDVALDTERFRDEAKEEAEGN